MQMDNVSICPNRNAPLIKRISDHVAVKHGDMVERFTVTLSNGIGIKNVMLFQNAAGKCWLQWPSVEYLDVEGKRGFLPIFIFGDLKTQINDEVYSALGLLGVEQRLV